MFGSTVLETAIGMVFVFLLVSILVTAASEMMANALQLRARCLRKGLQALLAPGNDAGDEMSGLEAAILQHPLVAGRTVPPAAQGKSPGKGSGPSYIPTEVFSTALLDTLGVLRSGAGEWVQKLQSRLAALPATGADLAQLQAALSGVMEELTEALDGADLRAALEKVAEDLGQTPAAAPALQEKLAGIHAQISAGMLSWVKPTLAEIAKNPTLPSLKALIAQIPATGAGGAAFHDRLRAWRDRLAQNPQPYALALEGAKALTTGGLTDMGAALERLPDSNVKQSLLLLYHEAGDDADAFKAKVGQWFDVSMNLVSGWYKRRTAWVNFATGVVLAVLLNVDALLVLKHLSTDSSLRTALVNAASAYTQKTTDAAPPAPATPATPNAAPAAPAPEAPQQHFQETREQLESLGLPIGWAAPGTPAAEHPRALAEQNIRPSGSALLSFDATAWKALSDITLAHALGWLLTGIAASVGAPFWFDLLSKFMNVRQTATPPAPATPPAA